VRFPREEMVHFPLHRVEDRVGPVLVLQAPHFVHILVDGQHPLRDDEREHDAEARLELPLVPAPVDRRLLQGAAVGRVEEDARVADHVRFYRRAARAVGIFRRTAEP